MFNRKPYPYKERVVNFYYRYYAKNLAVIIKMDKIIGIRKTFNKDLESEGRRKIFLDASSPLFEIK